jgi:hexosaminidase
VSYFIRTAHEIARKHNRTPCGWQEIFDHYGGNTSATPTPPFTGLDPTAVIYDWLAPEWGWANPGTIAAKGWRVVSTLGLYLSSDQDNTDWTRYYTAHPLSSTTNSSAAHGRGWFNVTAADEVKRVLGGEGCLWGEHTNSAVLNVRLWPRASAMAEALWSGPGGNVTEAYPRLLRQRCRMVQRGISVTPLQPGFC